MSDPFKTPYIPHVELENLPSTVTRLETNEGSYVYVVGTAHFSKESCEDVAKTINVVQPDIVLLELCASRSGILKYDEEELLREADSVDFAKLRAAIRQHGVVTGLMSTLLLVMSAHITKELGMAPGGEFRAAVAEARHISGCKILYADRPIQITLKRAMASLSLWQKIKLAWHLVTFNEPITKEDVEKCKDKDLLAQMMEQMTGEFPDLTKVFVNERDAYLAHTFQKAAQPVHSRLTGGKEPVIAVGVVGIGHVQGIKKNWNKEIDVRPLCSIPPPSVGSRLAGLGMKFGFYGICLYGLYKVGKSFKMF
ncbi:traB domain-containing protein-like [Oscarella lobularis]|uniref:traB domain-containing protein-like n=1 Tax=Oscarella lobularis TaxID=121494 RepID=UPI0033135AAF